MNPYVITVSGGRVDLIDPKPEMFNIEDIAHHLSMICRWGGATREFYSVAQHSMLVATLCCRNHRLQGLLHDAAEAYIGDMVRPFKSIMPLYQSKERLIQACILTALDVPQTSCECVRRADEICAATESKYLTKLDLSWPGHFVPGVPDDELWEDVQCMPAGTSRVNFLNSYYELR